MRLSDSVLERVRCHAAAERFQPSGPRPCGRDWPARRRSGRSPGGVLPRHLNNQSLYLAGDPRPARVRTRLEPSNFCAISWRHQPRMVSGLATCATFATPCVRAAFQSLPEWSVPHSTGVACPAAVPSGSGSQRQDTQPAVAIPDLPAPSRTQADGLLDCSSSTLHLLRCLVQNCLRVF
jgi:hypothetical protein